VRGRRPSGAAARLALVGTVSGALALSGCGGNSGGRGDGDDGGASAARRADRALLVGDSPRALAAGAGGVFVIDDRERSLRRFAADPLRRAGGPLALPGTPVAVTVGAGSVWVATRAPSLLVRVDARTGALTGRTALPGEPVAADVRGRRVWVALHNPDALVRIGARSGRVASGPLALPVEPSHVSARDAALWVGSRRSSRLLRLDERTGRVRRSFRAPSGLSGLAAGDGGSAWFAQGDASGPFGSAPIEGDYLDLRQDSGHDGWSDVAVGPRGSVYVLSARDSRTGGVNEPSSVYYREIVRLSPGTGAQLGSAEVSDDARGLAAGEGAAWSLAPATGDVPSGSWRLVRAEPRP
jgi:hypothetical protein